VYFVIDGTMNFQLGQKTVVVKPNTFVIIPAGTVHRQWNAGEGIERHLTMLLPAPQKGEPLDVLVDIKPAAEQRHPTTR
jgi:mannose-6-phosphate isomerase-like protein (cupin superfamily)